MKICLTALQGQVASRFAVCFQCGAHEDGEMVQWANMLATKHH